MPATSKQMSDIVILSTLGSKTFSKNVRVFVSVNVGAKISNHTLINWTIATPLFFSSTNKWVVQIRNIMANHTRTMYSILISLVYLLYRFTSKQTENEKRWQSKQAPQEAFFVFLWMQYIVSTNTRLKLS